MSKEKKLAPWKKIFADAYLTHFNGTDAYLESGRKTTREAARSSASDLLREPAVAAYISERLNKLLVTYEVTQERIMAEYARLAFSNAAHLFDEHGRLIDITSLPPEVSASIASIDTETRNERHGDKDEDVEVVTTKKVRLHDKLGALHHLAKMKAMFPEQTLKLSGSVRVTGLAEILDELNGADTGIGPAKSRAQGAAV
jgi:phage terminase small subunit